ncbi:MAG TPA: hypothetical protein PLS90_14305 [Candidatus Sumerlaeota bacterium]|nr:hypothetical protein [Candidatus Sumerlaeota bacterium]
MQRKINRLLRSSGPRRGSALVLVLISFMLLMMMSGGVLLVSTQQTRDRVRYEAYKDEFAAAELAINKAFGHIVFMVRNGTPDLLDEIDNINAPVLDGYDFPAFEVAETFNGNETVPEGEKWAGLNLHRERYSIDVTAVKTGGSADRFERPGVSMTQNLEITYIPLYLFAIFYDPLMEIAPGPPMVVNGLVHANGDAYIQANEKLDFQKNVSVAGRFYHGRAPGSGQSDSSGTVRFTKPPDTLVSMLQGGSWLDSRLSNWASLATATWGGGLRDKSHGAPQLNLPIPDGVNPYALIERESVSDGFALQNEKFERKAGLKILADSAGNVTAVDKYGNPVNLWYPDPGNPTLKKWIYSKTTFYDAREGKTVTSIDLNLGNMVEGGIMPSNGILYVSNEDQSGKPGVVRLTNGAKLPQSGVVEGFTVATDDPLYIKGDYNTVNKTLAMVACDSLMILSNAWNDANSTNYSNRIASETTVNTVCMQGNVPTGGGYYSGGVENYFRFLENWSGKDLNFSGSIILMWASQKFLGKWGQSNVYSPPNRKWSWDTALGGINGPPGAPRVVELEKKDWKMASAD